MLFYSPTSGSCQTKHSTIYRVIIYSHVCYLENQFLNHYIAKVFLTNRVFKMAAPFSMFCTFFLLQDLKFKILSTTLYRYAVMFHVGIIRDELLFLLILTMS